MPSILFAKKREKRNAATVAGEREVISMNVEKIWRGEDELENSFSKNDISSFFIRTS